MLNLTGRELQLLHSGLLASLRELRTMQDDPAWKEWKMIGEEIEEIQTLSQKMVDTCTLR